MGLIVLPGAGAGLDPLLGDDYVVMPWFSPGLVASWMTPPWGQVTTASAYLVRTSLADWNAIVGVQTPLTAVADPLGGTAAYRALEDTSTGAHTVTDSSNVAATAGFMELSCTVRVIPGTTIRRVCLYGGGQAAGNSPRFDPINGVVYAPQSPADARDVGTMVDLGGGWYRLTATYYAWPVSSSQVRIYFTANDATSYAGNAAMGFDLYDFTVNQVRASGLADLAVPPNCPFPAGKTAAFNLAEAVSADQLFYHYNATTGLWEVWNPTTTLKRLRCTTAELMALLSGTNGPFTALMSYRQDADSSLGYVNPFYVTGDGGYYLRVDNAPNVPRARRMDATPAKALSGGTATASMVCDAWTFDGSLGTLYRNAAVVDGPKTQAYAIDFVATLMVPTIRKGALCELSLWNRSLAPSEVTAQSAGARRRWRIAA